MKTTDRKPAPDGPRPARPAATGAESRADAPAVSAAPPVAGGRGVADPRLVQRLQGVVGNRAVAGLVAQRYTAPVKPPPSQAPGFRRVQADVAAKKRAVAQHPPAAAESKAAQDAAVAPPDDKEAQGKTANAEKMHAAKPGEFDKAAFIAAVNAAIDKQAPKNLDEADKFADSGKADRVKEEVDGKVGEGKKTSASDIETTTKAPPDTSAAKDKPVTPLTPDQPPANPGAPHAPDAIPAKQPAAVTDFSEGPATNDKAMADADVTEEQLKKGNEPSFDEALGEKKKAEQHSAKAPGEARAAESTQLAGAKAGAAASGAQAMASLTSTRAAAGKQVDGGKGETKSKDEQKRAQVTAKLQKVFDATKKDVETTLTGLDKKVEEQFTAGEKTARDAFTADHEKRMKAYKKKRYSGFFGPAKWAKDKLLGMPSEANALYQESRKLYVAKMQGVISSIADTIGTELGKAKARIAQGRSDLKAEVDKLPADLQQFGQEAAQDFTAKFEELQTQVEDKSQQLVTDLAQKYTQALGAVDEEIRKLQEANKGLVQKAVDAVAGVIKTIIELKNMLMGVLAKAASAIGKIIKDPIGFLGNLVRAVGAGLNQFIGNIGEHLKKGLVAWLLGTATKAGIEIPAKFDLKGIIQLLASMLGVTWANIRARITRKGVPDQAMDAVESSVPIASALAKEGPAGAAKEIEQSAGNLKSTILEQLKNYLIPTVIIAGITWILSLLNPASAFIRAVKAIIDIVTFVVTQGAQIIEFVNAVLDAVIAIAGGGAAGVPKMVESALAASIPVLLGVLASLLGIGSLAGKVRQVFQAAARPVNRAIDKLVDLIAKQGKKLWAKLKGGKPGADKADTGRLPKGGTTGRRPTESDAEQETPRSADVKKEARALLAEPTSKPVPGRQSLDRITSSVLGRLRPKGLKSLDVSTSEGDPVNFTVNAKASPATPVAQGVIERTSADYKEILRKAIPTAASIVPFLKKMAAGGHEMVDHDGEKVKVDRELFEKAWNKKPFKAARGFVKKRFRDAMPGHHEWIPSDYILVVLDRAQNAADIPAGEKWIDFHHEMRSDTAHLVFHNLTQAPPKTVEDSIGGAPRRKFTVPTGHVGAVYYKGDQQTKYESAFHKAVRGVFDDAEQISGVAANLKNVATKWIWDGQRTYPHDIHPQCLDKNGNQVTATRQEGNYKTVIDKIDLLSDGD